MTEAQGLALRVLEFALRDRVNGTVTVTPLLQNVTSAGAALLKIPELTDYTGRALYLDASVTVLKHLDELAAMRLEADVYVQAGWRGYPGVTFGAMLFDCRGEAWKNVPLHLTVASLPPSTRLGRTPRAAGAAFFNFADPQKLPWTSVAAPHAAVWCRVLLQAVQSGFVSRDYLKDEIRHGCVRPSLQYQVDELIEDPRQLPKHVLRRDESFSSPRLSYTHLEAMKLIPAPSPIKQVIQSLAALLKVPRPVVNSAHQR